MPDKNKDTGPRYDRDRLAGIMGYALKPLAFASKDSFQHINSVKGIEQLMERLSNEAISLGLPDALKERCLELGRIFGGFDSLGAEQKKAAVERGVELARGILESVEAACDERPSASAPPARDEVVRRLKALRTPLASVKGIGPRLAERLCKKGLATVEDVLYFLPIRYEDRRHIKKIRELAPGPGQSAAGEVLALGETYYGRKRVFEAAIGDGTGILKLKWFNFKTRYMRERFKAGDRVICFGNVGAWGRQLEMVHPDMERLDGEEASTAEREGAAGIVPVYSEVQNFHQKTIRKIVKGVVDSYSCFAVSGAPEDAAKKNGFIPIDRAFREAHSPSGSPSAATALARRSLAFDELFLLELGLGLKRAALKKESGISFGTGVSSVLEKRLREALPFRLTAAQERVLSEIGSDMAAPHPMNRLIQGDVGSGKTVVSLVAALRAVEAGFQAALMAPTEILSEQHFLTTHRYAEALGVRTMLLTGSAKKSEKAASIERIRMGDADFIIGTHALIQKDVEFSRLGLIIIDEQHRFGVVQRAALKKKGWGAERGISPDILIMTATPIPRTLSMTVFGDLDVSVIDELPPGRTPVETRIIREKERARAYDLIRMEVQAGRQCYIVYPLVEESEEMKLKDATRMKDHLQKDVFTEFRVGLLHGRLKADEKESVMREFKDGKIEILVSTTVIEVGVDVPNATVILIEHAERFGLAQLHQLRGRVGRGGKKSTCLLLAAWTNSEDTYRRLKVMEETMDGFRIAEEDLRIRGAGDFLGTRQAGMPDFRTSEALTDLSILKKAREEAFKYLKKNPGLTGPEGSALREVLKARWEGRLELAEIG